MCGLKVSVNAGWVRIAKKVGLLKMVWHLRGLFFYNILYILLVAINVYYVIPSLNMLIFGKTVRYGLLREYSVCRYS